MRPRTLLLFALGGYLEKIVDASRAALDTLPSRIVITEPARRLTTLIVAYQSLNLTDPQGGHRHLETWALTHTPPRNRPEMVGDSRRGRLLTRRVRADHRRRATVPAASRSSRYRESLLAVGRRAALTPRQPRRRDRRRRQLTAKSPRLLRHTRRNRRPAGSPSTRCRECRQRPPQRHEHMLLLAAMASSYLAAPEASSPTALLASRRITEILGPVTRATMALLSARHSAARLLRACHAADHPRCPRS
jgi:hypothetical protein